MMLDDVSVSAYKVPVSLTGHDAVPWEALIVAHMVDGSRVEGDFNLHLFELGCVQDVVPMLPRQLVSADRLLAAPLLPFFAWI